MLKLPHVHLTHAAKANKMRAMPLWVVLLLALTDTAVADDEPVYRHRLEALRTMLLSNYSGAFAPYTQAQEHFPVNVKFNLIAIRELNSVDQVLSTLAYVVVDWEDPDLWWDPSAVGSPGEGVDHLQLTSNDIWTPKLVLLNRAEDEQIISQYDTIHVMSAGHCSAELPIRLETTCQVDVANYPFDTQVCKVIFGALYQDRLSLSAQVLDVPLHQLFSVSGEWEIQNITVNPRDISFYKFVEYRLTLKRRPTFYLFTVIFPIVLLSVTGACGFLLPLECGEKVSFQVAIMVSLAVFLSFINDSMPKTSSSICRLAIYVDLLLLQSCLSFLATLTVLRGHHLRERLHNKDRERKHDAAIEPADQEIARDKSATTTNEHGWQRVKALGKRLLQCVRRTVRRMYCCCCCCIPPGMLDTFFFVVFMTSSLFSPVFFFMPNMPWESQILNVQFM